MQTYAYYFSDGKSSIVYSGDNGDVDFLMEKITQLGLPEPTVFHEVFFHFEIAAHAYYRHVMRWTDRYRVFGYHCDPQYAPADNTLPLVANHPSFFFSPTLPVEWTAPNRAATLQRLFLHPPPNAC
jgi:hypothetical protein